jgi:hypothetical protein
MKMGRRLRCSSVTSSSTFLISRLFCLSSGAKLAEPGKRRTAEPFCPHQKTIELRQPFLSKERSKSAKCLSIAPFPHCHD